MPRKHHLEDATRKTYNRPSWVLFMERELNLITQDEYRFVSRREQRAKADKR